VQGLAVPETEHFAIKHSLAGKLLIIPSMELKRNKYQYRRNLPHYQASNKHHFVTFKSWHRWVLPAKAKGIVFKACFYWHTRKMDLRAVVVMPDHVHLMFFPLKGENGEFITLASIQHSIKSFTAHEINKKLGREGLVWQDENFDHVPRTNEKYEHQLDYIKMNPVRAGLVQRPEDYKWMWVEGMPEPTFRF